MNIKIPPLQADKRTWIKRLVIGLGIIVILVLIYSTFFSGKKKSVGQTAPIPVRVKEVLVGDFPIFFSGLGTVTAANTVTVRSQVNGELMRLHFTEGQIVKANDLLAEIDPRPFQAQLDQVQGQLLRDQALLLNARQNLARSKILIEQDSTTQQDVDTNQALVRQYEGTVKIDKAQIASAKLQLIYSRITAPVGGRLGIRTVDVGNIISTTDVNGIVVITQIQPIYVIFTITEQQLPSVLQAMQSTPSLVVEAWDRTQSNLIATGKMLTVDNLIDTTTGTVRIKAQFDNKDNALFPNQFVNARIRVGIAESALIAPTAAVQLGNQGNFVYIVGNDNRIIVRPVETGPSNDTQTVITRGVQAGDRLVIEGLDRLRDKSLVAVSSDNPPGTPAAPAPGNTQSNAQTTNAPEKADTPNSDANKNNETETKKPDRSPGKQKKRKGNYLK